MKRYLIQLVIAAGMFLCSCREEALIEEPTQELSLQQIQRATKIDPGTQEANVLGMYSTMYEIESGGIIGSHVDFGQKSYDIYGDMLSGDMALSAARFGWYSAFARLEETVDFTFNVHYQVWRYYYRVIFAANGIIDGLGGTDAEDLNELAKHYMGQARAMRAYGYFYLTQFLARRYEPSQEIMPLYLTTAEQNLPRVTAEKVYEQIIDDLTAAISLLEGFKRSSKIEVNKYIAEGLLAYTYAAMGNYTEVGRLSKDIIDNGGYKLMNSKEVTGGFYDVNSISGVMWGVDLTRDIGLDLVSWWGQIDVYTFSYPSFGNVKSIDQGLYDAIKPGDIRKSQFKDVENTELVPAGKFYPEGELQFRGQRAVISDYVFMRVAEFYLLHIESLAKNGKEAEAKAELKKFLAERFENADDYAYVDGLSGQALQDEIYLQTRIELWGEGKSYLAMKRNKATITRGANHLSLVGVPIPYDDERLTFLIPQSEINNNPNIKGQNSE